MTAASSATTAVNTKGGSISVSSTVRNQGTTAPAVATLVGIYLSTDNVITTAVSCPHVRQARTN